MIRSLHAVALGPRSRRGSRLYEIPSGRARGLIQVALPVVLTTGGVDFHKPPAAFREALALDLRRPSAGTLLAQSAKSVSRATGGRDDLSLEKTPCDILALVDVYWETVAKVSSPRSSCPTSSPPVRASVRDRYQGHPRVPTHHSRVAQSCHARRPILSRPSMAGDRMLASLCGYRPLSSEHVPPRYNLRPEGLEHAIRVSWTICPGWERWNNGRR